MLRMAMPVAVPLVSSSNLDCSQIRVPSANAVETRPEPLILAKRKPARRKKKNFRALCNFKPRSDVVAEGSDYHGWQTRSSRSTRGRCLCSRDAHEGTAALGCPVERADAVFLTPANCTTTKPARAPDAARFTVVS